MSDKTDGLFAAYLAEVVDKSPVTKADINNLKEDKAYKLVIDQANVDKRLFVLNEMNGNFVASTDDVTKGADIYVEKVEGGVKLYFKDANGTKNYLGAIENPSKAGSYIIKLDTETVWTVTAECIKTTIGGTEVYVGTYNNFETYSISKTSFLSTSFAAYLAEVKA